MRFHFATNAHYYSLQAAFITRLPGKENACLVTQSFARPDIAINSRLHIRLQLLYETSFTILLSASGTVESTVYNPFRRRSDEEKNMLLLSWAAPQPLRISALSSLYHSTVVGVSPALAPIRCPPRPPRDRLSNIVDASPGLTLLSGSDVSILIQSLSRAAVSDSSRIPAGIVRPQYGQ